MSEASTVPANAADSRTSRIAGAVGFGYVSQVLTVVTGLWLTPFLLHRLGQSQYGLWLLALQMTAYLGLLDLGVVALLPRETAYAIGRAGGARDSAELPHLIARTVRIVLCQLPLVALAAVGALIFLPAEWLPLRAPLTVIVVCFLVMFPLRVLHAVLQGLQETPFLGRVALWTWATGTIMTVVLVLAGAGLFAVAVGWAVSQLGAAACWWRRLRAAFPGILPSHLPPVTRELMSGWLQSGVWVSVAQVAQMLLAGTDIFIIGHVLGPAAIVPYAMTGKLVSVLANQPQMVMQAAQPALSEIKATDGEHARLARMTSSLGQLMLLISGGVFAVVLAVNEGFIHWWVGSAQFAGRAVTFGLLLTMLLRHWNTTAVYTMFSFGHERRIAMTSLADGLLTVTTSLIAVHYFGVVGAVAGSLAGVCIVSLPGNLRTLANDTRSSMLSSIAPYGAWCVRLVAILLVVTLLTWRWVPDTFISLAFASVVTATGYALVMARIALRDPLGLYLRPWLTRLRTLLHWPGRENALR
jgi:O-antigen/teichoic acid export membrane protein